MKLAVAIPAYNEEKSIESIITRSLDAGEYLISNGAVDEVEIAVVSDGSTDRTVELAQKYSGKIRMIVFERNRGYGAAIQEAWKHSDAELLGFLDADGTCDPNFFLQLRSVLESHQADMAIGCRMNENSKMPLVRRLSNMLFAWMVSVFSSVPVRDVASGMRVVRRASLGKLLPLPDGLHFTPAMTARALLSNEVKVVEIDMPYAGRVGRSKLSVGMDGLRFLKVILQTLFLYRPHRPLAVLGLLCLGAAIGLMAMPVAHYLQNRSVAEWMIYRFVVSDLAGISACLLLSASYLTRKMVHITLSSQERSPVREDQVEAFFSSPFFWLVPFSMMATGGALVIPSFLELVQTGVTYEHWSRFIVMSFSFAAALILIVTRAVDYVLTLVASQLDYSQSQNL